MMRILLHRTAQTFWHGASARREVAVEMLAALLVTRVTCSLGMAVTPKVAAGSTSKVGVVSPTNAPVVGPTFSKPLSTPDPVPMAGQLRAMELMASGAMFRYTPGVVSETSLAEEAMCEYTGYATATHLTELAAPAPNLSPHFGIDSLC